MRCMISLLGIALALSPGLGCGPKVTTVTGEVTLDGTPVENGTITFEPADKNGPTFGGPIVKGKYEATGEPGKKNVFVKGFLLTGKRVSVNQPGSKPFLVDEMRPFPPQGMDHEPKVVELTSGENSFSVQLTTPEGADKVEAVPSREPQIGAGPPR
jgi:hypothetical protein